MTQAIEATEISYALPTTTGQFVVPWRYLAANDHIAEFRGADGAVLQSLSYGTDYAVSPDADTAAGIGVMSLIVAVPAAATVLYIRRATKPIQQYVPPSDLTGLEAQLDRTVMILQESGVVPGVLSIYARSTFDFAFNAAPAPNFRRRTLNSQVMRFTQADQRARAFDNFPATPQVFTLYDGDTSFGTVTIGTDGQGTFALTQAVYQTTEEFIVVQAPASPDQNMTSFNISLIGSAL